MAMRTAVLSQPLAIADGRYLWTEVERLKSQVHALQQAERHSQDEQQRLQHHVASFVTQAQLEAALCTTMSQSSIVASLDRQHMELVDLLAKKADLTELQTLQSKKLDISVYETTTWDLKKFRALMEQNLRDLFAQFAHRIESQVATKLSVDDFDRIFNPHTNGQKAALESAADRIARMTSQLDALQEYVHADRQRQHKLVDMDGVLLDLMDKHAASRDSIAQLLTALDQTINRVSTVEKDHLKTWKECEDMACRVAEYKAAIQSDLNKQQHAADAMRAEIDGLRSTSQQTTATLKQIQQFTQHSLLKGVDARLQQITNAMDRTLEEAREQQQKLRQQTTQQLGKMTERVLEAAHHEKEMEARVRHCESIVTSVRDDVAAVKGPLMTTARNLREENVAILEEIRRSQDESREILIDYKGLLEKDTLAYTHPVAAVSPSSARPASSTAAAVSRKHRQQQLHALASRIEDGRVGNNSECAVSRPQTSNGRLGASTGSRTRARTASSYGVKTPGLSAQGASSPSIPYAVDHTSPRTVPSVPQRPKSEACPRPKQKGSMLFTVAATTTTDSPELFVFPTPCVHSGDAIDTEPQQS